MLLRGSPGVALAWLASWLLFAAAPLPAQADWTVIPYGQKQSRSAKRASEFVVRALSDRRVPVVSLHETRDRFRSHARWSEEPSPESRARLAQLKEQAIQHAAFGRHESARRIAEEAIALASRNLEALNRDTGAARDLLDSCLAIVRVDLQQRDRRRAVEDAKRCRHLVPDLLPKESAHPAEVIGALAEAENHLRRYGSEALVVDVEGESDCAVFLNGRRLGSAPFRYEHGAPGESRVEIECGTQRSRVHIVNLGERAVTLRIAPDRDERVQDEGILALWYETEADERENLLADARAIGSLVSAQQLVLASETAEGDVLLVRYDLVRGRAVAAAQVPRSALEGDAREAWDSAADVLVREKLEVALPAAFVAPKASAVVAEVEAEGAPVVVAPASDTPAATADAPGAVASNTASAKAPPAVRQDEVRPRRVWTWVLGGTGLAAIGAGIGLRVTAAHRREDFDSCAMNCGDLKARGQALEIGSTVAFASAGALFVGSVIAYFVEGRRNPSPAVSAFVHPWGAGMQHRF